MGKSVGLYRCYVGSLRIATCSSEQTYLYSGSRGDSLSRTAFRSFTMDRLIAIHLPRGVHRTRNDRVSVNRRESWRRRVARVYSENSWQLDACQRCRDVDIFPGLSSPASLYTSRGKIRLHLTRAFRRPRKLWRKIDCLFLSREAYYFRGKCVLTGCHSCFLYTIFRQYRVHELVRRIVRFKRIFPRYELRECFIGPARLADEVDAFNW